MGCVCFGHSINYSDLEVIWCISIDEHTSWTFSVPDNIEIEKSYQNLMQTTSLRISDTMYKIDFEKLTLENTVTGTVVQLFRKFITDLNDVLRLDAYSNIPLMNSQGILSQGKRNVTANLQVKQELTGLFGGGLGKIPKEIVLDNEVIKRLRSFNRLTLDDIKHELKASFEENIIDDPINEFYNTINRNEVLRMSEDNVSECVFRILCNSSYIFDKLNRELRENNMKWSKFSLYYLILQIAIFNRQHENLMTYGVQLSNDNLLTLYRGSILTTQLIQHYQKNVNGFIMFNEFLSCTYNKSVALKYTFKEDKSRYNQFPCLFEFIIPIDEQCYAFIEEFSPFKAESEVVLMSMIIFEINSVVHENGYYRIILKYVSDGSKSNDYLAYTTVNEIKLTSDSDILSISPKLKFNKSSQVLKINKLKHMVSDMSLLIDAIGAMNLVQLELTGSKLTNSDLHSISTYLKYAKRLKILDLSSNTITEDGALYLGEALRLNNTIEELNLSHNNLASGTKYIVKSLISNKTLRAFNLSKNGIEDKDIECFDTLWNTMRTLQVDIDLSSNKITDTGAGVLANLLKNTHLLLSLSLNDNSIKEKGAIAVSEALKSNNSLEELCLNNNPLGDGLPYLLRVLIKNRTLTHFEVSDVELNNEGLNILVECMRTNRSLIQLYMTDLRYSATTRINVLSDAIANNRTIETLNINFKNMTERFAKNIS
jgi:Ran GTPase-activating protein (RanGAP) involved in mRNA processing and transport